MLNHRGAHRALLLCLISGQGLIGCGGLVAEPEQGSDADSEPLTNASSGGQETQGVQMMRQAEEVRPQPIERRQEEMRPPNRNRGRERPNEVRPADEMEPREDVEPSVSNEELQLQRMREARVVCFGELHDQPEHHRAQWRTLLLLLESASQTTDTLGVGFEMFQRPFQQPLSAFVASEMTERRFLEETEYAERWGWPFEYYRPLVEATRAYGADALALNASSEFSRQVAESGLAGLDQESLALLPELDLDDSDHACYFTNLGVRAPCPTTPPPSQYEVQVLWDETMAETASQWLDNSPNDAKLILFAGMAHCQRSAIPRRIRRRTGIAVLSVMPLTTDQARQLDAAKDVYDIVLPIAP